MVEVIARLPNLAEPFIGQAYYFLPYDTESPAWHPIHFMYGVLRDAVACGQKRSVDIVEVIIPKVSTLTLEPIDVNSYRANAIIDLESGTIIKRLGDTHEAS